MVIDIGAFRDLHRHRRCQKFRQAYSGNLGFDTPKLVTESGAGEIYYAAMQAALAVMHRLPAGAGEYLLPFGARSRFLFKMDFAEAEYISRLRSGVKGPLQLPRNRLGDEGQDGATRARTGPPDRRHSAVDRRPVEAIGSGPPLPYGVPPGPGSDGRLCR